MSIAPDTINILHVDDDPDIAALAVEFLEREDEQFHVATETSADEGLAYLAESDVDCIVSDLDMPGRSGIEFLEAVRESSPDLPFILFTGKGSEEVASEAISAGVTDYLQKESGTDQYTVLANRIRNSVEKYHAEALVDRAYQAMDRAREGIALLDTDGEFIYVNEAYTDIVGYDETELIGSFWELVYPEDQVDRIYEEILPTVPEEGYWTGDTTYEHKDGHRILVNHALAYSEEETMICLLRDRTEAEADRQALHDERQRFDLFVDAVEGYAIFMLDPAGYIVSWNAGAERITGYAESDILGEHVSALYTEAQRDAGLPGQTLDAAVEAGSVDRAEPRVRKDGSTFDAAVVTEAVYDEDGTHRGFGTVIRGVTERRLRDSEGALDLDAERRFITQTLNTLDDIFYVLDPDGRIQRWNDPLLDATGYSEAAVAGTPALEFFPEDEQPRIAASIETAISSGGDRIEADLRMRDGSRVPYEFASRRLTDSDGSVLGIAGTGRDISARKEREEEYTRVLDLLNHTQQIADVGGWEIDAETREVVWSDYLFELTGRHEDEPTLTEVVDAFLESDQGTIESAVDAALTDGESFSTEARLRRPDGDIRRFDIRGEPVIEDGEVVTLRGAIHDITDRRRREDVLREMHDIISNRHRSFEEQVQALLELGRAELGTEYGTLSEIHGDEYVFESVSADDDSIQQGDVVPVSATNCEIVASTEESLSIGDVERDAPEQTGRAGFAEWGISCYIGAPVFVEDEVYGTFCFYDTDTRAGQFSDWEVTLVDLMSSWASHELQHRQANERLQEQNDQLDEFTSIVSHDLRNPLNVAEGRLELAQEECNSPHLDDVARAHDRMSELIADLLALSHDGDAEREPETVNLAALARDCWASVVTTDAALDTAIDRQIRGDKSRLKQLLENLVRNAIEHGGDDVTVTIGELTDGFYVEDDGPGIPEDERDAVFDTGYSTTTDGTGFGLSIAEQVANAHDWEIRATSGSDGGARFEFTGVDFVTE